MVGPVMSPNTALEDEGARGLLEELERASRRSRPLVALALLAFVLSFALIVYMFSRERQQAAEIQELTLRARAAEQRLDATLQRMRREGVSPQLLEEAVSESDRLSDTLAGIQSLQVAEPPPPQAGVTPPATSNTDALQTVAAGNRSGWDIDIFWCRGPHGETNYSLARTASLHLASAAAGEASLASGVKLGRVRVRPLMEVSQRDFARRGTWVNADRGRGEEQAGGAIAAFLDERLPIQVPRLFDPGPPTQWYLSVFVCEVPGS
jgi:hypothetical protein